MFEFLSSKLIFLFFCCQCVYSVPFVFTIILYCLYYNWMGFWWSWLGDNDDEADADDGGWKIRESFGLELEPRGLGVGGLEVVVIYYRLIGCLVFVRFVWGFYCAAEPIREQPAASVAAQAYNSLRRLALDMENGKYWIVLWQPPVTAIILPTADLYKFPSLFIHLQIS